MRLVLLFLSAFFVFGTLISSSAYAREEGIAAVVNEDVISFSDLNERTNMILASSGLPDTAEVRKKLEPQVMASLIEEQIKLQEARSSKITVTPEEVDQGFVTIAQQNQMPPEKFKEMVKRSGINIETMKRQIEAQLAWTKVVQSKLRSQVTVTDSDIDARLEQLAANKGTTEYRLAEIFLPVEAKKNESDTRQLAQDLVREIKSGKAPFFKLAQQFSKAPGAAQGGDMGWVVESQIPEDLKPTAQKLAKNEVSDPVRSVRGYHILYLIDQRQISDENLPDREEIMNVIGTQRLERAQRRYLLDLKSAAFIENRVGS